MDKNTFARSTHLHTHHVVPALIITSLLSGYLVEACRQRGLAVSTQTAVLIDSLHAKHSILISSRNLKRSLFGEANHLVACRYHIADGIRHFLPLQCSINLLYHRSLASLAEECGLPSVATREHVLHRVASCLLSREHSLLAMSCHLLCLVTISIMSVPLVLTCI